VPTVRCAACENVSVEALGAVLRAWREWPRPNRRQPIYSIEAALSNCADFQGFLAFTGQIVCPAEPATT
jgi:hypothetical protein